METQTPLFHDDWRDALGHVVKSLGGWDAVGMELFPAKNRAGSWLYDCLHQDRPAKLDLEEIATLLRMGRERGVHVGMHELCREIGYETPEPSAARSKKSLLLDQQAAIAAEMARLQREIDRADAAEVLKAVKK
jgi:hypothetical protein